MTKPLRQIVDIGDDEPVTLADTGACDAGRCRALDFRLRIAAAILKIGYDAGRLIARQSANGIRPCLKLHAYLKGFELDFRSVRHDEKNPIISALRPRKSTHCHPSGKGSPAR